MPGFRVLQLIPGIGPRDASGILDALDLAADPRAAKEQISSPPKARADWPGFAAAMTTDAPWPAALGMARTWYNPHLDRIHEDAESRRTDLLRLEQIATVHPSAG